VTAPAPDPEGTEALERSAEVQRLAKLLSLAPDDLDYLARVSSEDLRQLRSQVSGVLFDSNPVLVRLAAVTRILPSALSASLAEKAFGAMLTARIAGLVEPDRAVEIAERLPVAFLAEVAVELDPRRAAAILGAIAPATVARVAAELMRAEQWVAMGTFLGYLPPVSVQAAIEVAEAHALLQISLVLEDKSELSSVLELAGADTLARVRAVAEQEGRLAQLRALEVYLSPSQRAQLPGA
jgi:hypothetical protein